MTHIISVARRRNSPAVPIHVPQTDDASARRLCETLSRNAEIVILHSLSEEGLIEPVARWERGEMNFVLPSETPAIIEGEIASDSPAISDDGIAPEDETVPEDTVDSGELFRAYCMKCHVNRMFHGQVRELANGSRAAQGNCPVCNTKLTRIVKKSTPLTEDYDTPDDEPEVTAGVPQDEQPTEDAPVEGLIAEAVAEAVPEGTQMEEIAAAASNLAAEFSSAVDEGEKQKPINGVPRKRQGKKKTEPEPTSDEDLARVKAMEVTSCPNCHNNIPVKESGDGQLRYIMVHPDAARKLDRCPGSMAKVD